MIFYVRSPFTGNYFAAIRLNNQIFWLSTDGFTLRDYANAVKYNSPERLFAECRRHVKKPKFQEESWYNLVTD